MLYGYKIYKKGFENLILEERIGIRIGVKVDVINLLKADEGYKFHPKKQTIF